MGAFIGCACSGGGGSGGNPFAGAVPETIPNLTFWWENNAIPLANGSNVLFAVSPDPQQVPLFASANNAGATLVTNATNHKSALNFPGTSDGQYSLEPIAYLLANASVFVVLNPTGTGVILGGPNNSFGLRLDASGPNFVMGTASNGVANWGNSTGVITAGAWHQINVTRLQSSGAISYRIDKAAAGTGTGANTISVGSNSFGYNSSSGGENITAEIAAICAYNRQLTNAEIGALETYFGRYGV